MPRPRSLGRKRYWSDSDGRSRLYKGDCVEILEELELEIADVIFADPPYFLSRPGKTTCQGGKRGGANKGDWDRQRPIEDVHEFNLRWLRAAKRCLKPDGTIWVSGTYHVIHSIGLAMQKLRYRILNDVVWEKRNPPPNLGCRTFVHSTETILWAAKSEKSRYYFDYSGMREANGGKQMKSVWRIGRPRKSELEHGKHPTQKPVELLDRILAASAPPDALVLDPFAGSGTTGVAANRAGLRFVGIEQDLGHIKLAARRLASSSLAA